MKSKKSQGFYNEKSNFENKLPRDVHNYLFGFFNQRELREIAQVNKLFQQLSDKEVARLKNTYKNNTFYTVGNPIQISDPHRGLSDMDLWMKERKNIPDIEIYQSFLGKNIKNLKIFKTKHEAIEYSRFLRTGDQLLEDTEVFQPAVFKVLYLGNTNNVIEHNEGLVINRGCHSTATEWCERTVNVSYFDTDRSNVLPLEGTLYIHLSALGMYKTHGPIDYFNLNLEENPNLKEENTPALSCAKSCVIS